MGTRSFRRVFLPLLAVLLCGASATETSERAAVRNARAALDRAEYARAATLLEADLARLGARDSEAVWTLRVLQAERLLSVGQIEAGKRALQFELPARYRNSETAVQYAILRGLVVDRSALDAARDLAASRHPALLGDVYVYLTTREGSAGEFRTAEGHAREALRLARKYERPTTEAKAMTNLAWTLAWQWKFAEAIESGERAVALARHLGMPKLLQTAEGNLGWAYFELGDYETAAALFASANETAARIGANADRVAWLVQLGNVAYQKREWQAADRFNRAAESLALQTRQTRQIGYALANLARIALKQGRLADAKVLNDRARAAKRGPGDGEAELSSTIVDARIAAASGDRGRAENLLQSVVAKTESDVTRVEAEADLGRVFAATRRPDAARTHFQNAAAAARRARDKVRTPELRFSFYNTVDEMFDAYVDVLVDQNRAEEALSVTETSRAHSLEEGLGVSRTFDARAVARENGATILCYWLGRDRSYLWVVTAGGVKLHRLPADTSLERLVESYRRDLLGPRGSLQGSGARGEELHRLLVAPAAVARDARVIVIADGALHGLNFETLVASPRHYWIEDVTVMNAPSLQLLARARPKASAVPNVLLVGNAPSPDPAFLPLLYAGAEMDAIARRFERRTVLQGTQATPAAYKSSSPEAFDYVHFVAHGVATRKRPLDSAVMLARDASGSHRLLARDVIALPLKARLVTISSCHGAGTRTYAGEGVMGLAWAFLRAGADQVIAALWEVNDRTTPTLMDAMYAGIRAGQDPAVALRAAKLKLVRSTGTSRNPRYWAPFVLYAGT